MVEIRNGENLCRRHYLNVIHYIIIIIEKHFLSSLSRAFQQLMWRAYHRYAWPCTPKAMNNDSTILQHGLSAGQIHSTPLIWMLHQSNFTLEYNTAMSMRRRNLHIQHYRPAKNGFVNFFMKIIYAFNVVFFCFFSEVLFNGWTSMAAGLVLQLQAHILLEMVLHIY